MKRAHAKGKNNMQNLNAKGCITPHISSTNEPPSYNETTSEDRKNVKPRKPETNRYNPRYSYSKNYRGSYQK